jgi:hypothetical protein
MPFSPACPPSSTGTCLMVELMTSRVRPPSPGEPPRGAAGVAAASAAGISLYLVLTGRWGSYVGLPGRPVYLTDVVLLVVAISTAVALARRERSPRPLLEAPVAVLLSMVLAAFAGVRLLLGGDLSVVALRDAAPYLYAVIAGLVVVAGCLRSGRLDRVVWSVLAAHTAWVVLLPELPGYPWNAPTLGTDAIALVPRPDVDSCVLGLTAALAVRALLAGQVRAAPARAALLGVLAAASWYGVLSLSTRAGLIAALVALAAVLAAATFRRVTGAAATADRPGPPRGRLLVAGTAALLLLVVAGLASPTGARLLEGLSGGDSEAAGTIEVRRDVWRNVVGFTFRTTEHTAAGIGFGRDFISESGSEAALEGETYSNVRSPHNYLIGTFARLGVAGALLAGLVLLTGALLAASALRPEADQLTALAALLALGVPVVAMLGVVLESPFGAVPYFWALGHLAATRQERLSRNQR